MPTAEREKLTAKQAQVYDLLDRGETPPAIAKKLKISSSGVYGHMRNIREAGVTLPSERVAANGDATNGDGPPADPPHSFIDGAGQTPEQFLDVAISDAQGAMSEVTDVIASHEQAIEQARAEHARLVSRIEKLDAARQALA